MAEISYYFLPSLCNECTSPYNNNNNNNTTITRCAGIHRPTSYRPVCGSVFCTGHRVKWWVSLLPLSASARTFSSNTANEDELFGRDTNDNNCPPQKIAIVGGGLAGLSTAFHMLELAHERNLQSPLDITVLDRHQVGLGGASAVAGGYVCPPVVVVVVVVVAL